MTRPKITFEKSWRIKALEILTYGLLGVSLALLVFQYGHLPDLVPAYFNWPSKANGKVSKDILWAIPLIFGIISLVLLRLAGRPHILNYPVRITEKNARTHYANASLMLRLLSLLVAITCLFLLLGSLSVSRIPVHGALEVFSPSSPFCSSAC